MSFGTGRWGLCLGGKQQGQGQEASTEMGQEHPSGCVCGCMDDYWHIRWVLFSFGSPLLFPQANQERVRLTTQNGELCCLKTIPFPYVGFGNGELIMGTQGGGGERYVSFRENNRKQRNEGSLILGSRTTRLAKLSVPDWQRTTFKGLCGLGLWGCWWWPRRTERCLFSLKIFYVDHF